jgi:hypothetical protein
MFKNNPRFIAAIADIDAANAEDPRTVSVDGKERSYESVYSERMTVVLERIYPNASELLHIAARAQHIKRWEIPREEYDEGQQGYNQWRTKCRDHHAALTGMIMLANGYSDEDVAHVAMLLKKQKLKREEESQALENVVDVVFMEFYWEDFARKYSHYDDDKMVDIIGKTLRKMSGVGHEAALALDMSDKTRELVMRAVDREKERLA